ncbi:sporulation protein Cse60 [Bacillus cereus]|uniref:Sporulation protein Cse60 n=1 Tax=Bacillus cereus MC67 TaxID=1053219 RepID=J8B809_BACCE|nr:sporulation protein Cse60 [Bacillus cereus]EJQ90048.1 hypothetical protein II3_05733 [Bacillus cereus MC67]EOP10432.1 hypothetical protein II1_03903 [Bacillus cereus MC118]
MIQTSVLTSSVPAILEDDMNRELSNLREKEIIDIKLSNAYDGQRLIYTALIIYREY